MRDRIMTSEMVEGDEGAFSSDDEEVNEGEDEEGEEEEIFYDEDEDDCHENLNRSSFCSRLFGAGGSISRNNSEEDKSMLYFGLASNAEQRTTVKLLEKNGCCT